MKNGLISAYKASKHTVAVLGGRTVGGMLAIVGMVIAAALVPFASGLGLSFDDILPIVLICGGVAFFGLSAWGLAGENWGYSSDGHVDDEQPNEIGR